MVLQGFNTEFKYKGTVYHVQTEDNGESNPVIVTLLYLKGAILASKKTSYQDLLDQGDFKTPLMELMKNQHRQIMKDVLAGNYDEKPAKEEPSPPKQVPPTSRKTPAPPRRTFPPGDQAPQPPGKKPGTVEGEMKTLEQAIFEYLEHYSTSETGGG